MTCGRVIFLFFTVFALQISATADELTLPAPLSPRLSVDGGTLINGIPLKAVIFDPQPSGLRRIRPPDKLTAPPSAAAATFSITYAPSGGSDLWGETCYTFPTTAKNAFNAAANIWKEILNSQVPITIKACWADLGSSSILGYSGGGPLHRDFSGATRTNTWYSGSLANALHGADLYSGVFDMHITYNRNFNWYYGTDGNPSTSQMDLMTVVLHEICHGLNFSGSMQYANGSGSWGYNTGYPNIYDVYMRDGTGRSLINTAIYPNNSATLGAVLISGNLWFHGSRAMAANGGQRVKMYAPSSWNPGSSYSHLDYAVFNNTPNQLMVFAVSAGESIHNPGSITKGLLNDLGWIAVSSGGSTSLPFLPLLLLNP